MSMRNEPLVNGVYSMHNFTFHFYTVRSYDVDGVYNMRFDFMRSRNLFASGRVSSNRVVVVTTEDAST